MTKEDFKKYKNLPEEREYLIRRIERLEKKASEIPIVADKVQMSQKEFPFVKSTLSVEAPEPVQYTKNRRELIRRKRQLLHVEKLLDELVQILEKVEDSRTRQILTERYVEGRKLYEVSAKFDLTDQHVLRIINEGIKNL